MNSEELKNRLEDIKKQMRSFKRLEIEEHRLSEIYHSSMFFNIEDIIMILARLIELVEKKKYYPVVVEEAFTSEIHGYFTGDKARNYAIVHADNWDEAFSKITDYIHSSLINLDDDNPIVIGAVLYNTYQKTTFNHDGLDITFKRLLDKYSDGNKKKYEKCCQEDFRKYEYVNDFIEYLFDLQVQNNGRHLTYDEMQVALNDFLKLEKDKPKTKSRVNESAQH